MQVDRNLVTQVGAELLRWEDNTKVEKKLIRIFGEPTLSALGFTAQEFATLASHRLQAELWQGKPEERERVLQDYEDYVGC